MLVHQPCFTGLLSFKWICSNCSSPVVISVLGTSENDTKASPRNSFIPRKSWSLTVNIISPFLRSCCSGVKCLKSQIIDILEITVGLMSLQVHWDFSLHHHIQADHGAHQAWLDYSSPSSPRSGMCGSLPTCHLTKKQQSSTNHHHCK